MQAFSSRQPFFLRCKSVARFLCSAVRGKPWPVEVKLLPSKQALQVLFDDGQNFVYPAEYLRVKSPSAENSSGTRNANSSIRRPRVISGRRHIGILSVEAVGNYAIRISFDDLHDTGIFTWPHLYDLGEHKLRHMREYIRRLRAAGLSREPRRAKATNR
eukprot:TRINITY_DN13650_c0_g1_i1.p1 TRINITY_DN13650_c0_g1~~TRINITY_DN13650_c0_g1_i1.p1  ORF type:complete len:159 (-),score=11.37 TRINITY_DN13650_c0_g1_i1:561-1037(-)